MNDIFSNLLDVCVMIYLDNILIYLNNMSEHHLYVKEVLKRLRKASLYAKAEKCEFHSESVEYLGYILSPSGLTMSDNKIKIIQDWPKPKKVKDIQSFSRFRKLLLPVHLQLLGHCHSIDTPHLEGHSLEVQLLLSRCFQLSQESIYLHSYPYSLDSRCSTHCGNQCLRLCSRCNPLRC